MSGVSMVIHPDTGDWFIDYFGQHLNAGDTVVYPAIHGSSVASLTQAVIERIVPLVEIPGKWYPTGTRSVTPHVRLDQRHKSRPTEYLPYAEWIKTPGQPDHLKVDYSRAFVLVARVYDPDWYKGDGFAPRTSTIKNVWNVIRVPRR